MESCPNPVLAVFRGDRLTAVWLLLIAATVLSWFIGRDGDELGTTALIAVIVVAFIKVRFVGLDFMELRTAPLALRLAFEFWLVATAAVLCGLLAF